MTNMNLKEIERRAFKSTYQDGLWDIYYGLIVISMSIFVHRPETGYSWVNIVLMGSSFLLAYGLFFVGKKFITIPRLGQVVYGEIRKRKVRTMSIVLGVFIFCQVLLLLLTIFGWGDLKFGQLLSNIFGKNNESMLVSIIAGLMVCSGMGAIVIFSDFLRGYYIAIFMSLAVFLMVLLNQPLYPILIGVVIIVPGIVLLIRFIKQYPLHESEGRYE